SWPTALLLIMNMLLLPLPAMMFRLRPTLRAFSVAVPVLFPRARFRSAIRPSARSIGGTEGRILFRVTLLALSPRAGVRVPATVVLLRLKLLTLAPTETFSERAVRALSKMASKLWPAVRLASLSADSPDMVILDGARAGLVEGAKASPTRTDI